MEENSNQNPEIVTRDNDELMRCKQQYAYLQADFDNYRRRMESQRSQWSQSAQADVLTQLIDIVDDFDRAQHDISNPAFDLIYKAFKKFLARFNVTEITQNSEFNPNLHEAIMQTPLVEGAVSGHIAQVLQKGYSMGSTILRPAKVAVYE
ncbi:MAG: nucleotide exchange factor GrpE [Candidatus Babeliaceae bacterium]|nr:nucleotide exchange factor GrpE [Candidatus Babeliaceae bacterium]